MAVFVGALFVTANNDAAAQATSPPAMDMKVAESIRLDLFQKALKNESTATNYILINVVNDKTGKTTVVCTEAPFLLGAIHREYKIAFDKPGSAKALAIALSGAKAAPPLTFHFSNPDALKNLTQYSRLEQVAEMRAALRPYSNKQIVARLKGDGAGLDKLYTDRKAPDYNAYKDALAQALLERGLLPERGCYVGTLTVAR